MTVLTVTIEQAINFDLSVQQDKKVVLVLVIHTPFSTHEFDVFLLEQFLVFSLKVTVDRLFLQERFIQEEQQFLLKPK